MERGIVCSRLAGPMSGDRIPHDPLRRKRNLSLAWPPRVVGALYPDCRTAQYGPSAALMSIRRLASYFGL